MKTSSSGPLLAAAIFAFLFLFFSGCLLAAPAQQPVNDCIAACQSALSSGRNLSSGPCLLNPMPADAGWVCDVAHNPRQPIDNLAQNQCPAYGHGNTTHFVEVDPACAFIRAQ